VLEPQGLAELEPELSGHAGGVYFPNDARIDPARLVESAQLAARKSGAEIKSGVSVERLEIEADRIVAVRLADGTRTSAGHVVLAAGSWTNQVLGVPLRSGTIEPARGQIVELLTAEPLVRRVVFGDDCYAVPRDDGRTLIGSTLEFVGFDREVTALAVQRLLTAAFELIPGTRAARLSRTWCNFRPYTPDERPLLGPTEVEGLILASGHYRTGILLAPITAEVVVASVLGHGSPVELDAFRPDRFCA
jgi:glycine oxidase